MNYMDYIRPELLGLIPALWFYAEVMKSAFKIGGNKIPLAIGIASIVLSSIWVVAISNITHYKDAFMAIFVAIVQGLLCAGASVYGHQLYTHHIEK